MNRALQIISAIVILVVVAGGSFYGGMVYGKRQAQSSTAATFRRGVAPITGEGGQFQFPNPNQQGTGPRAGGAGGALFGEIAEIGDGLLVIKDNNGKETQVHVTDTTLIEKNASVNLADLKPGETVIISGSRGDDGSITARSVQVAPAGRFGVINPGATRTP
ncbi:MAG: hypothetical protein IT330_18460 [Anaerolineae bacterium]|nr:hypothetical protein [Anaerolineae bacterium]